ncbi:unnamed protein product [Lathyrus oleraceus]
MHLRMARLESRNYMEEYNLASNKIPALLELAKLDNDMIQSLHQRELAEICRIQKDHGLTVVSYLKRTWMDMFDAYLEEAKCFNSLYVPSFRTYLDNGAISVGSCMALVHITFLIGDDLSKETISMMRPYPRLFTCSREILRFCDDLRTSTIDKEEHERGDHASSIECLMEQNITFDENESRKHIRMTIRNVWRELNGPSMTKTIHFSLVKASLNMARTAQVIYQHGDDKITFIVDDYVLTLIFTSLPTRH